MPVGGLDSASVSVALWRFERQSSHAQNLASLADSNRCPRGSPISMVTLNGPNGLAASKILVDNHIEASGMLMQMKNGGTQLP